MRYIDTHAHPQFPQYDVDREFMLERMRKAEVGAIAVGTSLESSKEAVELARGSSDIWAIIGVHPNDSKEMFDEALFESLVEERVVGLGECGLDYYRGDREVEGARQRKNFEAHIAFAVKHNLPLMLHVRSGRNSTDAHDEVLEMLTAAQARHGSRIRGNVHFFTAPLEIAKKYWSLGFTTAFPGVITYDESTHEVVREAPITHILSETDAPFAAPQPYRSKRNEPAFVVYIADAIAQIRGEDSEKMRAQLLENARKTFGLTHLHDM